MDFDHGGTRWWFSIGHFVMSEICWTSLHSRPHPEIASPWGGRRASSHLNMSPNTFSTPSAGSPTSWCHISGYTCNVLSVLPAFLYNILLPSGSHTTSISPWRINKGTVTSVARLSISFTTLKNSRAVAARGLPVYLRKVWNKKQNEYNNYHISIQNIPQRTGSNQVMLQKSSKVPTLHSRLKVVL